MVRAAEPSPRGSAATGDSTALSSSWEIFTHCVRQSLRSCQDSAPARRRYVFSDGPQIAGDASGPRLWIVLTSRRSVARDQKRSGYPGRPVNRAKQIQRTAQPFYTCHAERSEASQRPVVGGLCWSASRGASHADRTCRSCRNGAEILLSSGVRIIWRHKTWHCRQTMTLTCDKTRSATQIASHLRVVHRQSNERTTNPLRYIVSKHLSVQRVKDTCTQSTFCLHMLKSTRRSSRHARMFP